MIRDQVFQADNGDRADVPNVIIVITDGQPTTSLNPNLPSVVNISILKKCTVVTFVSAPGHNE